MPVGGRPRNPHRSGAAWALRTVSTILANPRYTGRQVWNRQRTDGDLADPAWGISRCSGGTCPSGSSPTAWRTRRWSARPTSSPPRTSASPAAPCPAAIRPCRRNVATCWPGCWLAGRAGGGWNQRGPTAGPPTGAATATPASPRPIRGRRGTPTPGRTASCPACPLCASTGRSRARRSAQEAPTDVRPAASPEDVIGYLREHGITLTYDPAAGTLQAGASDVKPTLMKAS